MATPISWRDIAAPSAGSANSLIQQSSRTFNDSFEGINNLGALAREQSIRQDQEQKQALANAQFGRIVNATDPNQLNDISFAGLGAQGANVASLLQGAKKQFSDIGNTNASTTGLINENNAFDANNTANLELTGSQIRGNNADAAGTEIGNLSLAERNQLDIEDKRISNFGSYNTVRDEQLQQQAGQQYYGVDAKARSGILGDNSIISGNNAEASQYVPIDAKQRSSFLPKQLQSGLDSDASSRKLQLAQGNAVTSNAATNAFNGQTNRQRLAFDKTKPNKGSSSSSGGGGSNAAAIAKVFKDFREGGKSPTGKIIPKGNPKDADSVAGLRAKLAVLGMNASSIKATTSGFSQFNDSGSVKGGVFDVNDPTNKDIRKGINSSSANIYDSYGIPKDGLVKLKDGSVYKIPKGKSVDYSRGVRSVAQDESEDTFLTFQKNTKDLLDQNAKKFGTLVGS